MKQTVSFNGTSCFPMRNNCFLCGNGTTSYERLTPPFKQKKVYGI